MNARTGATRSARSVPPIAGPRRLQLPGVGRLSRGVLGARLSHAVMLGLATVVALQGGSMVVHSTFSAPASEEERPHPRSTVGGRVSSLHGNPSGYAGEIAIAGGTADADVQAPAAAPAARTQIETYVVREGDTIRQIAERYGLETSTIFWANDLPNPDLIIPGQELTILPTDGVLVTVEEGDTLWGIALEWGANPNDIFNHPANDLTKRDLIMIGQQLVVPGGRPHQMPAPENVDTPATSTETVETPSEPAAPEPVTTEPEGEPEPAVATVEETAQYMDESPEPETVETAEPVEEVVAQVSEPEPAPEPTPEPTPVPPTPVPTPVPLTPTPVPQPPAQPSRAFIMPTQGVLTQHFGWTPFARANPTWYGPIGHPGLDFAAPAHTPIVASAAGRVIHAGWSGGYGFAVGIDHGNGYVTWYAHMAERPPVSVGQWVDQGQYIGPVGTTGLSTGNHLHFEIRRNGQFVDPLQYLQ